MRVKITKTKKARYGFTVLVYILFEGTLIQIYISIKRKNCTITKKFLQF